MDFVKQTISPFSPPRGVEHRPGSTTNLFKATFFGGWFLGGQLQDSYNLNFLWHQTEMSTKLSMYNKKRGHTKVILTEQGLTKRFVGSHLGFCKRNGIPVSLNETVVFSHRALPPDFQVAKTPRVRCQSPERRPHSPVPK